MNHAQWVAEPARRPKVTVLRLLLIAILLLGGLYWYYFHYFRWTIRHDPTIELTVVKISPEESHLLVPFRRKTISDVIDPCQVELDNLKALMKRTKGKNRKYGQLVPKDWDRQTAEILVRLTEVWEQAKQRRIPERYDKEYLKVLWGVRHTYGAILSFREYCAADHEDTSRRNEAYRRLKKHRKKALSAFKKGREWFIHDAKAAI